MSPIDVTPESLLKWLKSGQFRKDYSELPEPLPKAMGGAVYRAQLVPIKVRQVSRTKFKSVNDDRRRLIPGHHFTNVPGR